MLRRTGPEAQHAPSPQRILLLAMLPIGDTLFTLPTVRAIRNTYPRAHITMLAHSQTRTLLHSVPEVDEVVIFPTGKDWHGLRALWNALRHLRAGRYDVSVDLTSPAYKWINWVAGARRSTYMKFDPLWWIVPQTHRRWRSTSAMRHYFDCARELRLAPWEEQDSSARFVVPSVKRNDARRVLREAGVTLRRGRRDSAQARPVVVVHPGGAGLRGLKRWPVERFAALCSALQNEWDAQVVVLGGPDDSELASRLVALVDWPIVNMVGRLPLLTSVALIEMCDLFIGNDSSPLHFAAASGTPFVGIFGPTCLANFRPSGAFPDQGVVVSPRVPCVEQQYFVGGDVIWRHRTCTDICQALATIRVDDVLEAASSLLRGHFAPAVGKRLGASIGTQADERTHLPDVERPPAGEPVVEPVAD